MTQTMENNRMYTRIGGNNFEDISGRRITLEYAVDIVTNIFKNGCHGMFPKMINFEFYLKLLCADTIQETPHTIDRLLQHFEEQDKIARKEEKKEEDFVPEQPAKDPFEPKFPRSDRGIPRNPLIK